MACPLVKVSKKGKLYTRPQVIEAKIDEAMRQDWNRLAARLKLTDRRSADFLPSECLVHLIRQALRRDDERLATILMSTLLRRAQAALNYILQSDYVHNAKAVHADVLSALQEMFVLDGTPEHEDELDYFECKFVHALRTLSYNIHSAEKTALKRLRPLPEPSNNDGESGPSPDEILAHKSYAARIDGAQENRIYLREVLRVVQTLPADERRAVVLVRIMGYEVESEDPAKKTAATICGVSGRTIRNRLSRADELLKKIKEDL